MAIERSNLINISKLVVKELMESSVPFGRMLDSDHVPLQHFFIVLEHALRHGLRPKRVSRRLFGVFSYVHGSVPCNVKGAGFQHFGIIIDKALRKVTVTVSFLCLLLIDGLWS